MIINTKKEDIYNMNIVIHMGYKYRIYPSKDLRKLLDTYMDTSRGIYNHFLGFYKETYKMSKKPWDVFEASRMLTWLKKTKEYAWMKSCPATVSVNSLRNLDEAYKRYFEKQSGFPKFKKKRSGEGSITFQLQQDKYYKPGVGIYLTSTGMVKFKWTRVPKGKPKMVTVSKDSCNRYFISFSVEEKLPVSYQKTNDEVGIDLGLKDVVVLSNGEKIEAPKYFRKLEWKLKKAHRILSRMTKYSKRWEKQRLKLARIYKKISNLRSDFTHKLTTDIVRRFDRIAIEDLNVSGMARGIVGGKSVMDACLYEIRRQLTYKSHWYGRELIVIERFVPTTSVCSSSSCHHKLETKLTLSQRSWVCPKCYRKHDRDINAAKNILRLAKKQEGYL